MTHSGRGAGNSALSLFLPLLPNHDVNVKGLEGSTLVVWSSITSDVISADDSFSKHPGNKMICRHLRSRDIQMTGTWSMPQYTMPQYTQQKNRWCAFGSLENWRGVSFCASPGKEGEGLNSARTGDGKERANPRTIWEIGPVGLVG